MTDFKVSSICFVKKSMELRNLSPSPAPAAREDEELLLNRPRLGTLVEKANLSTILDSVFNFTNSIVGAGNYV